MFSSYCTSCNYCINSSKTSNSPRSHGTSDQSRCSCSSIRRFFCAKRTKRLDGINNDNLSDVETQKLEQQEAEQHQTAGGWRTMPYILSNDFTERLATVGLAINFISYLMDDYHMSQVTAASVLSILSGTASLTPLLGAFLSDAYIGRFWTIMVGSVAHLIGLLLLMATAAFPFLRPEGAHSVKATGSQLAFLFLAMAFLTVAAGGIRPCSYAFGADQFQQGTEEDKKKTQSFFNWYFFLLYAAVFTASTLLVYVQDYVGWLWGFAIPSLCVVVSMAMLLAGRTLYRHVAPPGSPFKAFANVIMTALRRRKFTQGEGEDEAQSAQVAYYQGSSSKLGDELPHTNRFKWLDHAAMASSIAGDEINPNGTIKSINPTIKICTLTQVEELKSVLALTPIWLVNLMSTTVLSHHGAFNIPQARRMNRRLGSSRSGVQIPAASMSVFSSVTLILWMPVYDRVIVPRIRKRTGFPGGIKMLQRIGIGFFLSILGLIVSALVEAKRRHVAQLTGRHLSAFWLVPQYCLFGLGESFHSVGQLEFLYDQLPDNMRSVAGAVFWCSAGLGSYAGTAIIQLVNRFSARYTPGHVDWLADDLDHGHLDYYFYLLAVMESFILVVFVVVSRRYTYNSGSTTAKKKEKKDATEKDVVLQLSDFDKAAPTNTS